MPQLQIIHTGPQENHRPLLLAFNEGDEGLESILILIRYLQSQKLYQQETTWADERWPGTIAVAILGREESTDQILQEQLWSNAIVVALASSKLISRAHTPSHRLAREMGIRFPAGKAHIEHSFNPERPVQDKHNRLQTNILDEFLARARKEAEPRPPLSLTFFEKHQYNKHGRVAPIATGGTFTFPTTELLIRPSEMDLKGINAALTKPDPQVLIPACPCDEFYVRQDRKGIYYTGERTLDGISWATQNALAGLERILPELLTHGILPNINVGLGDAEWHMGGTRGELWREFLQNINMSAENIALRLASDIHVIYGHKPEIILIPGTTRRMNRFEIHPVNGSTPLIIIDGLMGLAGGYKRWDEYTQEGLNRTTQQIALEKSPVKKTYDDLWKSRHDMYLTWANGLHLPEEKIDQAVKHEFTRDLMTYSGLHLMAQDIWPGRVVVLAGDSRPAQVFGASVANNPLISVSGLYSGAYFK